MSDLPAVLHEATRFLERGEAIVLATVVQLEGPGYRRPGARMVVTASGERLGAISAGCLESDIIQQALAALEAREPRTIFFDVQDDDPILGFGTGCGGKVTVLLEPMPLPDRIDLITLLSEQQTSRTSALLATVTRADAPLAQELGRKLFIRERQAEHDLRSPALLDYIRNDALSVLQEGTSMTRSYMIDGVAVEVLFEVMPPRLRLMVFGNGYDVAPVVRLAARLNWLVSVAGNRPAAELIAQFPEAAEHHLLMHPEEAANHLLLDARTAALVITHNYARDKALLNVLLKSPLCYVGMLGPRSRTERILQELGILAKKAERLYAPAGLDIHAETPEEIALSILSEIQAVSSGRSGGHLKDRHGAIHEPVAVT